MKTSGDWLFRPGAQLPIMVGLTEWSGDYWKPADRCATMLLNQFPSYLSSVMLESPNRAGAPYSFRRASREDTDIGYRSPWEHSTLPEWVAVARTLGSHMYHASFDRLQDLLSLTWSEYRERAEARAALDALEEVVDKQAFVDKGINEWHERSLAAQSAMFEMLKVGTYPHRQTRIVEAERLWPGELSRAFSCWRTSNDVSMVNVLRAHFDRVEAERVLGALRTI